jgi:protein SCO1/2
VTVLAAIAASLLLAFDGSTDQRLVARELDLLRARGADARAEAPALAAMLREQSVLYQGRGPNETARLRGYFFATLADIGPPPEALPFIVAELAHGHRVALLAAAARAAGATGPSARAALPHLLRIVSASFHDDQVCLDRYNASPPFADSTTARLEAVRALGRIGARDALPALRELAASASIPAALKHEAQRAMWIIERPDRVPSAAAGSDFVTPWLAPSRRFTSPLADFTSIAELDGKPLALTFAYTRCDNPNKCPVTIASMARLQRALRAAHLEARVRLLVITLDPRHDDAVRLATMGKLQGLLLGENALMLRPSADELKRLERTLDVPVGHGAGQVNGHGIALYLFDRHGRYVRRYHSVVWNNANVLSDLRKLSTER